MNSTPENDDSPGGLPAPVNGGRRPAPIMTPQSAAVHRNFTRSVKDLKRDLVRVIYYLDQVRNLRIHSALGYPSLEAYGETVAGFTPAQTRRFLQLGRQLRDYPLIAEALTNNTISFSKALLICSRTTPDQQQAMLDLAKTLTYRELHDSTADASPPPPGTTSPTPPTEPADLPGSPREDTTAEPAEDPPPPGLPPASESASDTLPEHAPSPQAAAPEAEAEAAAPEPEAAAPERLPASEVQHVGLRFTPEQYSTWATLLDHLRRRSRDDNASLVLQGLHAIAHAEGISTPPNEPSSPASPAPPAAAPASGPAYLTIILQCPDCGAGTIPVRNGEAHAPDALLAAAHCDGIIEDADGNRRATIPPRLRRLAFQRARMRCEAPGCQQTRMLEVHHRTPNAKGGKNHLENLIVLCWKCHRDLHATAQGAAKALRRSPG